MKKILAIVAAVAVVSSVASAQLLKNFKLDGSLLEVNAYNLNNDDFNDNAGKKKGDVDTRLMLNMSFDLNDDANAVVTLVKNNRQWGDVQAPENLNALQNNIKVHQAYVNLKGVLGMDHKLGRQFYGDPGDLVIYYGPKMWPYQKYIGNVNAIDAFVPMYNYKDWSFTGIIGKEINTPNDMGTNLSGVDIKKKIDRFNLNAYYYYKVDNTAKDQLGLYGFRANGEFKYVEGLNLGLEYDRNAGSDSNYNKYKGYAYKVNAGYTTDKVAGKLGLNAEYAYLSGEDAGSDVKKYKPIKSDYRPGIIMNGFGFIAVTNYNNIDTNIGTGRKYFLAGFNWTPEKLNKLNLAFDYINAKVVTQRKPDNTLVSNSSTKNTTLGSEYDFVVTWNHSDKISLKGYYAMFKPEKDNVSGHTDDMYTALGGAFVIKF